MEGAFPGIQFPGDNTMKKIWQKSSASQLGMTMLEIVLALGLSALVTLAVVEFYSSYTKKLKDMGDTIESSTDIESGQQILLKDLKSLEPSFSALNLLDDTGKSFFEYYPDVPERDLDQDPI